MNAYFDRTLVTHDDWFEIGANLEVIVACMKASPTALYPRERVKILDQVIIRQQDTRTIVPQIILQKFDHYCKMDIKIMNR